MLTGSNANSSSKFRDCLFPGGEEGAGGVLVAEEAFYQVHSQTDETGMPPAMALLLFERINCCLVSSLCEYILFPVSSGP